MDRSVAPWRVIDDPGVAGAPEGRSDAGAALGSLAAGGQWRLVAGLAAAAFLVGAAFLFAATSGNGSVSVEGGRAWTGSPSSHPSDPSGETSGMAAGPVVDVQGAVIKPGVLHLPPGARVGDAIAAAGGYGPRVDASRAARELNLAALLHDGDRVAVPSRDDPPTGGSSGTTAIGGGKPSGGPAAPLDLNSATATELDALPGIGPVTAQKIIAAREEQRFTSVDDLRKRKLVGASLFERLRMLVSVR